MFECAFIFGYRFNISTFSLNRRKCFSENQTWFQNIGRFFWFVLGLFWFFVWFFNVCPLFLKKLFESKWETVVRTPALANKLSLLTSLMKIDLGQYTVYYNYRHV